ncbi:MAG: right-handed parallel beta-helix repeat-containing protein [Isosphaeraceae bacterium]|nr:right-handed parallel beta-helix repeat-containing protein [Isosphaeraceae bacterium]
MSNHGRPPKRRPHSTRRLRPGLEAFEPRLLLAIVVSSNADDLEPGTLRYAITEVNAGNVSDDTVVFAIDGSSVIDIREPLPAITHRIFLEGYTQPGSQPNSSTTSSNAVINVALVSESTLGFSALVFDTGSDGSRVTGLSISGFGGDAIEIRSDSVIVNGNYLGVATSGRIVQGNGGVGVFITGSGNTVGGSTPADLNVISGNAFSGVAIDDGASNRVIGNFIGPDASGGFIADPEGATVPGNGLDGVHVLGGSGNSIGGSASGERNVISGNRRSGVRLESGSAQVVIGNLVGLEASGTAALGNIGDGILVDTSSAATIGGSATGSGNVVAGNGGAGVAIVGSTAPTSARVLGNTIGLGPDGSTSFGNAGPGVSDMGSSDIIGPGNLIGGNLGDGVVLGGSANALVGSTVGLGAGGVIRPNARSGVVASGFGSTVGSADESGANIISGNTAHGIRATGSGVMVLVNDVGLAPDGLSAAPNGGDGLSLEAATGATVIGGRFSGNTGRGIVVGPGSTDTRIEGAIVGLTRAGTAALGNDSAGIAVLGASGTSIGGATAASGNVVSGNGGDGIDVGFGTPSVRIRSNRIGTDRLGSRTLGNAGNGIRIEGAVFGTTIGEPAAGNTIAGNGSNGVVVSAFEDAFSSTPDLSVAANLIGLLPTDGAAAGNAGYGIFLIGVEGARIGGGTSAHRNVVSSNAAGGIRVGGGEDASAFGSTTIQGNDVGLGVSGLGDRGNGGDGIAVLGGVTTTIGGGPASGNRVAHNRGVGIRLDRGTVAAGGPWIVSHNIVGLDGSGAAAGNRSDGILVERVSGAAIGPANVVGANAGSGIRVEGKGATGIAIVANVVGVGLDGLSDRGNSDHGIDLAEGDATRVGGLGAGNTIGFNGDAGILIRSGSTSATVLGNRVGTSASAVDLGNRAQGILVLGSSGHRIGGTAAGEGNVVAANRMAGIQLDGAGSSGNSVVGNSIGLAADGRTVLDNLDAGVWIREAGRNTVGADGTDGTAPRNLFAGNGGVGLLLSGAGATGNAVLGNWFGLDATGASLPAVGATGILLENAPANRIGAPGAVNVASNTSGPTARSVGIHLLGPGTTSNLVQSNRVGTDPTGTIDRGNNVGILIDDAPRNTIGGAGAGVGNVVSGNDDINLSINGPAASANLVQGNIIGLAANGVSRLADQRINDPDLIPTDPDRFTDPRSRVGLQIQNAPATTIVDNTVSDNRVGIGTFGSQTVGTQVALNRIGTDLNGAILRPGQGIATSGNGVGIFLNDSPGTLVGGVGRGNLILGNQSVGVEFFGPLARANVVQGNTIGASDDGVFFAGGSLNTIGGATEAEGNLIESNRRSGVYLASRRTFDNLVAANRIERNGTFGIVLLDTGLRNTIVTRGASRNRFVGNRLGQILFAEGPGGIPISVGPAPRGPRRARRGR